MGSQRAGHDWVTELNWTELTTLPASWEICMQVKKQQFKPDMDQQTGSILGKEYIKLYIVILLLI